MDWQEITVGIIGVAILVLIILRLFRRGKSDPCAGCKNKNGNCCR